MGELTFLLKMVEELDEELAGRLRRVIQRNGLEPPPPKPKIETPAPFMLDGVYVTNFQYSRIYSHIAGFLGRPNLCEVDVRLICPPDRIPELNQALVSAREGDFLTTPRLPDNVPSAADVFIPRIVEVPDVQVPAGSGVGLHEIDREDLAEIAEADGVGGSGNAPGDDSAGSGD